MAMADAVQPRMMAASAVVRSNPCLRFVGESVLGSWGGCGLQCCFESGEPFFEDTGDGEQAEQGGFGDVATVLGVAEQGGAQE